MGEFWQAVGVLSAVVIATTGWTSRRIEDLRTEVRELRTEMHARFDNVTARIDPLYRGRRPKAGGSRS